MFSLNNGAPEDRAELEWGLRLQQAGLLAEAAESFGRAAAAESGPADAPAHLVAVLERLAPDARRTVAARLAADAPAGWHRLALALQVAGESDHALRCIDAALALDPIRTDCLRLRATLLFRRRNHAGAVEACRRVLAERPDDLDMLILLPRLLLGLGDADGALAPAAAAADAALDAAPDIRRAVFLLLADAHRQADDAEGQIAACRRLVALDPHAAAGYVALGRALWFNRRYHEGLAVLDKALTLNAGDIEAAWQRCMLALLPIYADTEQIERQRQDYAHRLRDLAQNLSFGDAAMLAQAEPLIGNAGPFWLPYQNRDDRELQATYGAMIARIVQARHPGIGPKAATARRDGRIRVGFVSAYFWLHSNWKLRRGWLELDRERFHVTGYHLGERQDDFTEELARSCDDFVRLPRDFEGALRRLRDDAPDVLIYPELGMHPETARLACLRLAPVQCVSWGHPVTSGLPTIDYFLSSDLMEPEGAEAHYTEALVRLPGLSFDYRPALAVAGDASRAEFDLPEEACLYLCCQSVQKYLPEDDDIYPAIAAEVPEALFVFIEGLAVYATEILRDRLAAAFRRRGLDPSRHLRFLPHMDNRRYQRLNAVADVFLDSIGWSGANTTLQAAQHSLPIVTLPGEFMRGRHGLAILRMLGIAATVAADKNEYVAIAVRLGRDPEERRALAALTRDRLATLAEDRSAVAGLAAFVERAVVDARRAHDGGSGDPLVSAAPDRGLVKGSDGFLRRPYRDYDEYLEHQRSKLALLDLTAYDRAFERELRERLAAAPIPVAGSSVLCLGARLGTECRAFVALGGFAVGVDLNPGPGNSHVVIGDFHHLQFADSSVDIVYSNCLDHSFDLAAVVREAVRVMKPDGRLVLDMMGGLNDDESWMPDGYDCLFWENNQQLVDAVCQVGGLAVADDRPFRSAWGWPGRMVVLRRPAADDAALP